jgi:hypothetical protein
MKKSIRQFIHNYESGEYNSDDRDTMIEAGWYDWFCEDQELKSRLDEMFPKVKQCAESSKVDMDTMYVFFKNNCPCDGDLYDDFRFCDIRTGDVVYTIVPATGHTRDFGQSEVWGQENGFKGPLAKGNWADIEDFFNVRSAE